MSGDELAAEGALPIAGACEFLGVGRTLLYGLLSRGALPSAKIDGRRVIPRAALRKFLADRLPAPAGGPNGG